MSFLVSNLLKFKCKVVRILNNIPLAGKLMVENLKDNTSNKELLKNLEDVEGHGKYHQC